MQGDALQCDVIGPILIVYLCLSAQVLCVLLFIQAFIMNVEIIYMTFILFLNLSPENDGVEMVYYVDLHLLLCVYSTEKGFS